MILAVNNTNRQLGSPGAGFLRPAVVVSDPLFRRTTIKWKFCFAHEAAEHVIPKPARKTASDTPLGCGKLLSRKCIFPFLVHHDLADVS